MTGKADPTAILGALLVGAVTPLGKRAAPSGIAKTPVDRPLWLGEAGLEGDAQGDIRRHGGPEKAVHHYPFDHYAAWRSELGPLDILSVPGAFGENVSTLGMTEDEVAIGDVFELGGAVLQVSQGRQPCWKLDERFSLPSMAREVQRTGRTGWYHRVLRPGRVSRSDVLIRIDRPAADWTIARVWRAFYVDTMNRPELAAIADLPTLAQGWRDHAARRLATGRVEDWTSRLDG